MVITVIKYFEIPDGQLRTFEKSEGAPFIFAYNGIDHYIFSNLDRTMVTWTIEMSEIDVDRLGVGLDEGNIELSAGQKQIVAILRTLYNDADVIILDEPTANIDIKKEQAIFSSLKTFEDNKLILLISHRMSNVHYTDYIIFMDEGKIVAIGNHDELMQSCSDYKDLYLAQSSLYN